MEKNNDYKSNIEGNKGRSNEDIHTTVEDTTNVSQNILSSNEKIAYVHSILHSENITIEKINAINEFLSLDQVMAIGGRFLSLSAMTIEKLPIIGFMLSGDEIKEIGAEKLALMNIKELNIEIKKYN